VAESGAEWIAMAGHSLGGLISFLSASQSDIPRAVCVIGSRLSDMRATHFLSSAQKDILEKSGEVSFTSRGRFLTITEEFFADAGGFDLPGMLSSFDRPLLIIHGDQDEIIPVAEAHRTHDASGGRARLEIISGADHMFGSQQHRSEASRLATAWFQEQSHH
jgi:pimeloyl-ACP methyl ester carboxylesterase